MAVARHWWAGHGVVHCQPEAAALVLLGIDPGLAATGYGIVSREGARCVCLAYGCIRTKAGTALDERLRQIHEQVSALLREHRPDVMVLERLYQLRGGNTGLSVGQAIGVVRLAAAEAGLAIAEYAPTHVKMTLVGTGAAAKAQVQFMVQRLLNLDHVPKPDHAADALALCVCHLHSGLSRAGGGPLAAGPGAAAGRIAAALEAEAARRAAHREREASR